MDTVGIEARSRMMASVRSKDTWIETAVRRHLFSLGFRYRLHAPELPGKPDILLPRYKAAIFIHGCFWHNHSCPLGRLPATQRAWWRKKLIGNRHRDVAVLAKLHDQGWRTAVVWECSFRAKRKREFAVAYVAEQLSRFLRGKQTCIEISGIIDGNPIKEGGLENGEDCTGR